MAVIVREQGPVVERAQSVITHKSDAGAGWVVGLILLVLLAAVFFVYGLPALRNAGSGRSATLNVNVNKDAGSTGGPSGSVQQ